MPDDEKTNNQKPDVALTTIVKALGALDGENQRRVLEAAAVFIGHKITFQPLPPGR